MNKLLRAIKGSDHESLKGLMETYPTKSKIGFDQAKHIILGLSGSVRGLNESELNTLSVILDSCDIDALVRFHGGEKKILSEQLWLCSVPGITSDKEIALEYLGGAQMFANILLDELAERSATNS